MEVIRVGQALRVDTPAKLNLFLEILGKRDDGYHELETLMAAISICDTLYVTENSGGTIRLTCNWASGMETRQSCSGDKTAGRLPAEQENLVYRAAERLRVRAGIAAGVRIHLVKRIPAEAGMGGASSDAAAALMALNRWWGLAWPVSRLSELAAELGSDVPFFLSEARPGIQAATCRGRGERIAWEAGIPPLHLVVVKPPVGLSTAAVYRACTVPELPRDGEPLRRALHSGDPVRVGQLLFNRLQETAERICPWVQRLRRWFDREPVVGHQMSGSGTSYFGVCRHARQARQIAARLRGAGTGEVYYAATIPAL